MRVMIGLITSLSSFVLQVSALILENTFTSILDMAGVLLPFLKWFIGGSCSKGPKLLNFLVRSPWSTIDVVGEVRFSVEVLALHKPPIQNYIIKKSE